MSAGDLAACLERAIACWHGIAPPSERAQRALGELAGLIGAVGTAPGGSSFEETPATFPAALRELAD